MLLLIVTFVARQALSWCRSSGERRQQLKWLASGAIVTVACALLTSSGGAAPGPADRGPAVQPGRYDADAAVTAFAGRLQDAVDLEAVRADLLTSVAAALEPAHVSVWLHRDRP